MRNACLILIIVALAASGCANAGNYESIERRANSEPEDPNQPLRGDSTAVVAQIVAFFTFGLLRNVIDPDSQLDPDAPHYTADYSPYATRKELGGR
jgi:hypothetical protein